MKIRTPKPKPWELAGGPQCLEPTNKFALKSTGLMIEPSPVVEQPVTSQKVRACFAPPTMTTEPMTFPNMVTGFVRNPQHAARTALQARYSTGEWANNFLAQISEANTNRNMAEKLKNNAMRLMRETDEKSTHGQRVVGRLLGQRLTDVDFWKDELNKELDKLVAEVALLAKYENKLTRAIQDLEIPLHIAQECLYYREARKGIEKTHDYVERNLLQEVSTYRASQDNLKSIHDKIMNQFDEIRATQQLLEDDIAHKESTLRIDTVCQNLNNFSSGLGSYDGIEKYDPTISTHESWYQNSNFRVEKSIGERKKSFDIRTEIDILINKAVNDIYESWSLTNDAFDRRLREMTDAKDKVEHHLAKVQQEIFNLEKNMFLLRKAIKDKMQPLKVAQTRMEIRNHREDLELCKDFPQLRLVEEIRDIEDSELKLIKQLEQAKVQYDLLSKTCDNLEADLRIKVNALFIDREKCMGLRNSIPVETLIKL